MGKRVCSVDPRLMEGVREYLDAVFISPRRRRANEVFEAVCSDSAADYAPRMMSLCSPTLVPTDIPDDIKDLLNHLDEGFSDMLIRLIREKGMTDSECYRKANIDRKLYSKIKSDKDYRPTKQTAVAFAIALELPYDVALDLLQKAGYSLSHCRKFDVIVEYFLIEGNYDIFSLNQVLLAHDQKLVGNVAE